MLKLLGALVLLAGAGGLAFSQIAGQQERLNALMEMRSSLIRMKQQVVYVGVSAPLILEREVEYQKHPLAEFYRCLIKRLEERSSGSFYDALLFATERTDRKPYLREEWNIFLKAMESLFSLEQVKEEQAFEGYLKQLEDCIGREQEAKREKRKVTLSVTLMGAALVLLLLL